MSLRSSERCSKGRPLLIFTFSFKLQGSVRFVALRNILAQVFRDALSVAGMFPIALIVELILWQKGLPMIMSLDSETAQDLSIICIAGDFEDD